MATEMLSSSQLGDRGSWPEAARTLVRRLRFGTARTATLGAARLSFG